MERKLLFDIIISYLFFEKNSHINIFYNDIIVMYCKFHYLFKHIKNKTIILKN